MHATANSQRGWPFIVEKLLRDPDLPRANALGVACAQHLSGADLKSSKT